jgi:tryptophanyl-tRNA synthetase
VANRELAPLRERFNALVADPAKIEAILEAGAHKARAIAKETLRRLRDAVGITLLPA